MIKKKVEVVKAYEAQTTTTHPQQQKDDEVNDYSSWSDKIS
jgi:hypothetical protein